MKYYMMMIITTIAMLLISNVPLAIADNINDGGAMMSKIIDEMRSWSSHPIILDALKTANQENAMSIQEIIEKDNIWRSSKAVTPFIQQFLTNDVAKYLQQIQVDGNGLFAEIEITDIKGVIIAETSKTTDYYQADEAWWQHAYQDGIGDTFCSKPSFDESSHSYNIDVAMPIRDQENNAILGIVKTGVSIMKLRARAE